MPSFKFAVEIEERLWREMRKDDAFASDEEALRHILTIILTGGDASGTSTRLALIAGKIKVRSLPAGESPCSGS